jgi:hypothetical protein
VRQLGTWLRRAAAGAAVVVAITGFGATGAAASTDQSLAPESAVLTGDAGDEFGVQHTGRLFFTVNSCTYVGWSEHKSAGTERASGACGNDIVYVRAYVCTTGACLTTDWRSSTNGRAVYNAPSGYTIRSSWHRACRSGLCSATGRIDHLT